MCVSTNSGRKRLAQKTEGTELQLNVTCNGLHIRLWLFWGSVGHECTRRYDSRQRNECKTYHMQTHTHTHTTHIMHVTYGVCAYDKHNRESHICPEYTYSLKICLVIVQIS